MSDYPAPYSSLVLGLYRPNVKPQAGVTGFGKAGLPRGGFTEIELFGIERVFQIQDMKAAGYEHGAVPAVFRRLADPAAPRRVLRVGLTAADIPSELVCASVNHRTGDWESTYSHPVQERPFLYALNADGATPREIAERIGALVRNSYRPPTRSISMSLCNTEAYDANSRAYPTVAWVDLPSATFFTLDRNLFQNAARLFRVPDVQLRTMRTATPAQPAQAALA